MLNRNILTPLVVGIFFMGCLKETPLEINSLELDEPDSNPIITESIYADSTDFSEGYYNGSIRTDQVTLEWEASSDDTFLAYKIFRASGSWPDEEYSSVGFEDGQLPNGWEAYYSDNIGRYFTAGWSVTNPSKYVGNYGIATSQDCNECQFSLMTSISVLPNTYITISFNTSEPGEKGDGNLFINETLVLEDWDNNSESWTYSTVTYNTGSNTELELMWLYNSGSDAEEKGYVYIDNIEIESTLTPTPYSLIETLNDKNTTTFIDTVLTQNKYYTYKVASIITAGTHKVAKYAIKTPKWQDPADVITNGLSQTAVELYWKDNTESETAFKIYIDTMSVSLGYVMVDSTTAAQDDTTNIITSLSPTATYRFSIKATNSWEEDTPLGYSSSFTFGVFNDPTSLVASQEFGRMAVSLNWNDNSSQETGFYIERDNTGNGTGNDFATLATVAKNITSYTDMDTASFNSQDEIVYRVIAYNDYSVEVDSTNYSNESSITIATPHLYEGFEGGNFESGSLPADWSTSSSTNGSAWSVNPREAYEGNYSIHCGGGSNNSEYLNLTINVPQNTTIDISFYQYEGDTSGDGDLYILDSNSIESHQFDWDSGGDWNKMSTTYNTSLNTQITLQWKYDTNDNGDVYLDNIQVSW